MSDTHPVREPDDLPAEPEKKKQDPPPSGPRFVRLRNNLVVDILAIRLVVDTNRGLRIHMADTEPVTVTDYTAQEFWDTIAGGPTS